MIGSENSPHFPNQSNAKLQHRLHVICLFPCFNHFEFSLANDNINLCSNWSPGLLWLRFLNNQLKICLRGKANHKTLETLTNPQIQWLSFRFITPYALTKVSFFSVMLFYFKRGKFRLRYPNSVISTRTITSASSNHDHRITPLPATPEADLISTLQVTAAWSLSETNSFLVMSAILNIAFS